MKHPIGTTRNNTEVYINLIGSSAAKYIAQYPYLLRIVTESLSSVNVTGDTITFEHDMGRVIGYDFVVETSDADTVFYARAVRESIYTRFVKNGKPKTTQYLTMELVLDEELGQYELSDVWIGKMRPVRPGGDDDSSTTEDYWLNHAFVFDNSPVQASSITKTCPY